MSEDEMKILTLMHRHPNREWSKEEILWGAFGCKDQWQKMKRLSKHLNDLVKKGKVVKVSKWGYRLGVDSGSGGVEVVGTLF